MIIRQWIFRFLKKILNKAQRDLRLTVMSPTEKRGVYRGRSHFKLFRGSAVELPFNLGRTIRGLEFTSGEDPFCACLNSQDLKYFNQKVFAATLLRHCRAERDSLVRDFLGDLEMAKFNEFPAWAIAFPWEEHSIDDLHLTYLSHLENRQVFLR